MVENSFTLIALHMIIFSVQTSNPSGTAIGAPPGLSSSWAFPTSNSTSSMSSGVGETFQEDEDPCAICHEELTEGCTITLECAHKFHDEVSKMSRVYFNFLI